MKNFLKKRWLAVNQIWNFAYIYYRWFIEPKMIKRFLKLCPENVNIRFSIVTPTFKIEADYVELFFNSLLKQTFENFEIAFCIDGEKNPEVLSVIDKYKVIFKDRLKIIKHDKNQGICAATKSALTLASGDYIVFIDADDELHCDTLKIIAGFIGPKKEYDFIYTDHDMMTDWGLRYSPMQKPANSPELLLHVNYINHLTVMSSQLVDKIPNIFSKDAEGSQDWDICLKALSYAQRIGHVPFYLYHWRMRPGSVALEPFSKPWAYAAQTKVRDNYITSLFKSDSFTFNTEKNCVVYKPDAKVNAAIFYYNQKNHPTSSINDESKNTHELEMKIYRSVEKDPCRFIDEIYLIAKDSQETTFLFLSHPLEKSKNDLRSYISYASIPNVSCVYPFIDKTRRASYTIRNHSIIASKMKSNFANYSGNVLCGPTNGLSIKGDKLVRIIDYIRLNFTNNELSKQVDRFESIGAIFGLVSLELKNRNMCSDQLIIAEELKSVNVKLLSVKIDLYW